MASVGPGLIVMEADNDAGAVSTYVQAGAQHGTHLLWIMLLLLPITYFIQKMVVRLGIATGQGHAAMIYKRFGKCCRTATFGGRCQSQNSSLPVEKYVIFEDPSREDSKAPFSQYASPLEMPGFCFMGTSPWISCARIRLERSPKTEWF